MSPVSPQLTLLYNKHATGTDEDTGKNGKREFFRRSRTVDKKLTVMIVKV